MFGDQSEARPGRGFSCPACADQVRYSPNYRALLRIQPSNPSAEPNSWNGGHSALLAAKVHNRSIVAKLPGCYSIGEDTFPIIVRISIYGFGFRTE